MKTIFTIITIAAIAFQSLHAQQEKRLALVIGNANYDKGGLNNPVNDALLMAKTLKAMDFDVILDTNVASIAQFTNTVRKFGEEREKYNVGFIYYAGHGVQINSENYLLATKENYKTKYDVEDKALSVQKIMRFLTNKTSQVNVLILDACRDNPFEKNWNPQARSTDGGRGLAKIPAPTGSLIAYSTDAGNTAADGDGKNSIYCVSLTKNMQLENTTLDQVFRNVRTDVLKASGGSQRPVEASQLTGDAFYLKKGTYTDDFILIDSLIEDKQYEKGLEIAISVLNEDKNNKSALIRKGRLYSFLNKNGLAIESLDLALKLFPNDAEVLMYRGRFHKAIGEFNKAIFDLNKALEIDSTYTEAFWQRGLTRKYQERFDLALADFSKAIELDPLNTDKYLVRAMFYNVQMNNYNKAFIDFTTAIKIKPNDPDLYYERGVFIGNRGDDKLALDDFKKALEIDPSHAKSIKATGVVYKMSGQLELAIKQYEKGIALIDKNPNIAASSYFKRAEVYILQGKFQDALLDYNKAIELFPKWSECYNSRAFLQSTYLGDINAALIDYSKVTELTPNDPWAWFNRGHFYTKYSKDYDAALKDYKKTLIVDSTFVDAIIWIGINYEMQEKTELAIEAYKNVIILEKTNPESAAYCYNYRALIYQNQGKTDEALADFTRAIQLVTNISRKIELYEQRARLYKNLEQHENALKDYSNCIEIDENNAIHYIKRAFYLQAILRDFDLALKDINKAIKLSPNEPKYYTNRAYHYNEYRKNYKLALKDYTKSIELAPESQRGYLNRGLFYTKLEQYDRALIDFNTSIKVDSTNLYTYFYRAKMYIKKGQLIKAEKDYLTAASIESENPESFYYLSLLYKSQNRILKAEKTLTEAIRKMNSGGYVISKENGDDLPLSALYIDRADIYFNAREIKLACEDYQKALELMKEKDEPFYLKKEQDQKALEEKINNLCN